MDLFTGSSSPASQLGDKYYTLGTGAKVRFTEHAFIQSEDTDPFTDADLTVAYILFPQTNFAT